MSLRDGFKFHYVTNDPVNHGDDGNTDAGEAKKAKPLVVLIHGFPDSWVIWRHLLQPHPLRDKATLVAVDLPGYGGSDRLSFYSATQVLELLTEFIIVMRERCHIDRPVDGTTTPERVIIVGHDVGCVLATRLAAEASELADRFILVNGPLVCSTFQGGIDVLADPPSFRFPWSNPMSGDCYLRLSRCSGYSSMHHGNTDPCCERPSVRSSRS